MIPPQLGCSADGQYAPLQRRCLLFDLVRVLSARAYPFHREEALKAGHKPLGATASPQKYAALKYSVGGYKIPRRHKSGSAAFTNESASTPGQHGVPFNLRGQIRFMGLPSGGHPTPARRLRSAVEEDHEDDALLPSTRITRFT